MLTLLFILQIYSCLKKKKIHVFLSTTPCSRIGHEAFETKNSLYNLNSYMIYYLAYTNNNILYNQYSFLNNLLFKSVL